MSPLRADAARNRTAVLCAAASVFAASGPDAAMDEVAREAGVGIATLYRRFPTRESLIEAVYEARVEQYADRAEAAAIQARTDPWTTFVDYVEFLTEAQIADPAFGAVLLRPMQSSPVFTRAHDRATTAAAELIEHNRTAGAVRPDLGPSDLYLLLVAVSAVLSDPGPFDPTTAARRLATLFIDSAECRS